ncbi:alanine racemase [Inediibacterium massiliense]|uniref:alanine racemase n=1 Tax=Inediibacterium massiliense TaxID=1658111 RepID=UPI000A8E5219|nr:alanine racemase [Inediibacterium massiliense]
MLSLEKTRPVWAEINLDHLAHNMREIRNLVKKEIKITGVIKADAYGHGALEIGRTLLENGAERFAVATLSEALELRKGYKDTPILILGYTPKECAQEVIENNIIQTIYSLEDAKAYSDVAQKLKKYVIFHIKIDTGMSRIGFLPNKETVEIIKEIIKFPYVKVEGMFTHFAVADAQSKDFTNKQYERFISMDRMLKEENIHIPIRHVGNSATIMDLPDMHLDMVRAGVILYGLYPSEEVKKERLNLKPVLSLKAKISHVKTLDGGVGISYGLKFFTPKKSKIATLPIGYADGFTRMLSGKGEALVKGKKVPVVGRICMDQCMIDVSSIEDIQVGEQVILIGSDGKNTILADDLANQLGTINYEIVCMLGRRIPRVYIKNNEVIKIKDYLGM